MHPMLPPPAYVPVWVTFRGEFIVYTLLIFQNLFCCNNFSESLLLQSFDSCSSSKQIVSLMLNIVVINFCNCLTVSIKITRYCISGLALVTKCTENFLEKS